VQIKVVKENVTRDEKFGKGDNNDTNYRTTSSERRSGWSHKTRRETFLFDFSYSTRDLR